MHIYPIATTRTEREVVIDPAPISGPPVMPLVQSRFLLHFVPCHMVCPHPQRLVEGFLLAPPQGLTHALVGLIALALVPALSLVLSLSLSIPFLFPFSLWSLSILCLSLPHLLLSLLPFLL